MKLIELHILQSFPVSCLNRDDVGSPKSAVFGGVQRARISSQCLKRAVRLEMNDLLFGDPFHTKRTRLAHEELSRKLVLKGFDQEEAFQISLQVLSSLVDKKGAKGAKVDKSGRINMPAVIYLSPGQLEAASKSLIQQKDEMLALLSVGESKTKEMDDASTKALTKLLHPTVEAIRGAGISDAPDIAFFGRMVANDPSLNVEGTAMFAHALSTHKATNEVDFYTAVDDEKARKGDADDPQDAGSAMNGTLEFTSATFYRYAAVNLDLLASPTHLRNLAAEERKAVVDAFIRATLMAVPGARKNSMNASTLPYEVLGVVKEKGQPVQLINAFEKPVRANGKGLAETSLDAMKTQLDDLKRIWSIKHSEEVWLTESGLDTFLQKLTSHVE